VGIALHWRELRAGELVLEELAPECDGVVPIHPGIRRAIDELKAKVVELRDAMMAFAPKVELVEPDQDTIRLMRELAHTAEG
jgi:hypothetical protein